MPKSVTMYVGHYFVLPRFSEASVEEEATCHNERAAGLVVWGWRNSALPVGQSLCVGNAQQRKRPR
jgi:hypothetical protein